MASHPPQRFTLDRMELRRTTPDDAQPVADAVAANLSHLVPWMPWAGQGPPDVEAERTRLADSEQAWQDGETFAYLAVDRERGEILGMFGLHRRVGPGALELGYWLCRQAVGRGHATAAAAVLTTAALELDGVERVEVRCDQANVRSWRVPERLGYRLDRTETVPRRAPAETGADMVWVFPASGGDG